ncbi:UNVERIFIED_CONTAM: hypothetical protein GTU68_066399 [Idotea baltica]|nr:hypothetical protein [Idotea baltica]
MTDQTAWIVIQRRLVGTQPFDKSWIEYKNGFGDLNGEFWLGNEKLHQLTSAGSMKIRFDLWNKGNQHGYAEYSKFSMSGESDAYRLTISGYSGNAGDSMGYHNQKRFSTKDQENDDDLNRDCSNE